MMRTLSCKRMAQMISLYVAGDLVGGGEREVAAHLAACEGCRRLAEEFSDSSSLLTEACMPPEFGEEFYSGIRRAVLGEIARDRMTSKPSLFRRRWVYATAFAALVITAGVMLQHFSGLRRRTPQELVVAPQKKGQPTAVRAKEANSTAVSQSSPVPQSPRKSGDLRRTARAQSTRALALGNARGRYWHLEKMRKADALLTVQTAWDKRPEIEQAIPPSTSTSTSVSSAALESNTFSGGSTSAAAGRASAVQISRIEIQTSDPNIRIIWLTPQESREPTESNHDPDQQQNGKRR